MVMVRTWIEPVVATAQLSYSFYDTGLLMVVQGYYNRTNPTSNSSSEDTLQKSISDFYIIYNLLTKLTPFLSAYIVTKLGDKIHKKITLCLPLTGYLVSTLIFLFLILWDWPIQVIFGSGAFIGLTGGFPIFWSGVMVWASLSSSESHRSIRLTANECVFGIAGFAGSLISGHIFNNLQFGNHQGVVLVTCSIIGYTLCLIYSICVLRIPCSKESNITPSASHEDKDTDIPESQQDNIEYTESSSLINAKSSESLPDNPNNVSRKSPVSKVLIFLLFISAALYNSSVNGAEDVISLFVLKEPLKWGPVEVGYGNAAAYMIFVTSFLGVIVLSKCFSDLSMIVIGMFSFAAGIMTMAFVSQSFMFYIARVAMIFSLIPVPTIRSMLSKRVQESSYGKIFVVLQIILSVIGVMASVAFNAIYQVTLHWFSGFTFIVIFIIAFISCIPISIVFCREKMRKEK
ncbi:solute carrier family 46 member 2-like [Pelobates fuscus]|uniref:solute carrier family 46 member 2-like n=1 Tax=Pelobates fuscus TaxID=191477 RepID=UPI002FE48E22